AYFCLGAVIMVVYLDAKAADLLHKAVVNLEIARGLVLQIPVLDLVNGRFVNANDHGWILLPFLGSCVPRNRPCDQDTRTTPGSTGSSAPCKHLCALDNRP